MKTLSWPKEIEKKTLQLQELKVQNKHLVKDLDKALTESVKCRENATYLKKLKSLLTEIKIQC